MQIVGPKSKLGHIKRTIGVETADGTPIIWGTPIRFEGIMFALVGRERLAYHQFGVSAEYKVYTNYMAISEKDKVTYGLLEYDVKFVDPKFLMNKIAVVLLSGKTE